MREFKHVSASQIDTYIQCPRKWWYNKILGIKTPTHPSAALGTKVHAHLERYLTDGTLPPDEPSGLIARAGLSHLPAPGTVEVEWDLEKAEIEGFNLAGLPVKGFIDCWGIDRDIFENPLVNDHKTTSSLQWAKTAQELRTNVQILVYSEYTFRYADQVLNWQPDYVDAAHTVYLTKGTPLSKYTPVTLSRAHVAAEFAKVSNIVSEMRETALIKKPSEVNMDLTACGAYGGCFFLKKCKALGAIKAPKVPDFIRKNSTGTVEETVQTSKEDTPMSNPVNPALAALAALAGKKPEAPAPEAETKPVETKPVETKVEEKATTSNPLGALALLAKSGKASEVETEAKSLDNDGTTETSAPAAESTDNGSNGVAPGILGKFNLQVPKGGVVPPDAPQNVTAAAQDAEAAAKAQAEAEAKAAAAAEALVAKAAGTDNGKSVRRPRGYKDTLAGLGWTEEQISAMSAEQVVAAIDNDVGPDTVGDVPAAATVVEEPVVAKVTEPVVEPVVTPTPDPVITAESSVATERGKTIAAPVSEPTEEQLILYIDCYPMKGPHASHVTFLEDLVRPYMLEIAKDNDVHHYSLIEYGKGNHMVAAYLSEYPPTGVLVASTRYPSSGAALEVLVPMADVVIRAAR